MKKEEIAIIGLGGFGREVKSFLKDEGRYNVADTIDAYKEIDKNLQKLKKEGLTKVFIAVGDIVIRKKVFSLIKHAAFNVITIVHPDAYFSSDSKIGEGSIVYPKVVVNANVAIGDGVLINSGATIGHDSIIEDFSNINPGVDIAGNVKIGKSAFIGIGSSIIERRNIGKGAIIGAGAVVIDDIPSNSTAVGVPAKCVKLRKNENNR